MSTIIKTKTHTVARQGLLAPAVTPSAVEIVTTVRRERVPLNRNHAGHISHLSLTLNDRLKALFPRLGWQSPKGEEFFSRNDTVAIARGDDAPWQRVGATPGLRYWTRSCPIWTAWLWLQVEAGQKIIVFPSFAALLIQAKESFSNPDPVMRRHRYARRATPVFRLRATQTTISHQGCQGRAQAYRRTRQPGIP